jgi:hypothetical protein
MFTMDCSKTHDKIQHISLWTFLGPMGTNKIQHISLWTILGPMGTDKI